MAESRGWVSGLEQISWSGLPFLNLTEKIRVCVGELGSLGIWGVGPKPCIPNYPKLQANHEKVRLLVWALSVVSAQQAMLWGAIRCLKPFELSTKKARSV